MGNAMRKAALPSTQMISSVFNSLYEQFTDAEIKDFKDFHDAILEILNVINSALPGKHYDAPARSEVEACFEKWRNEEDPAKKKEMFFQFIKKIKLSKLDNVTIMTGILTPPAAMAAKKAGEFLPHLSVIKSIPDVVFVPSVTIAALVISKLSRRIYRRRAKPQPDRTQDLEPPEPPHILEPPELREKIEPPRAPS